MPSIKHLMLLVAFATVVCSTPLPSDDGHEEDHGQFLFNDSSATADSASGAKNATVELSNATAASNSSGASDANVTLAPDHLERADNATVRLVDTNTSMSSDNSSLMSHSDEHKEVAVEEAEDATKDLAEDRNSSRLFNQTRAMGEEPAPMEGDDKPVAETDSKTLTTGEDGEVNMTTEKSVAGLKDDEGGNVVPLTTPASPLTLSAHPVEKHEEEEVSVEPSVLRMRPVLRKNNTIQFRSGETDEWRPYVDNMAAFLKPYSKEAQESNVHCDFEKTLQEDQACRFDLVYLGPSCTEENNFGYGIGKPCVLITPGHFADWVPSPYENDTTDVPDEVQRLMRIFNANFLFVTCEGESESDRANIGPMAYLPPYQGFPSYFFPDKKDTVPNYVSPLMAIEFLNPTNGTLINVVCKAWAKNVNELPHPAALRFSLQVN